MGEQVGASKIPHFFGRIYLIFLVNSENWGSDLYGRVMAYRRHGFLRQLVLPSFFFLCLGGKSGRQSVTDHTYACAGLRCVGGWTLDLSRKAKAKKTQFALTFLIVAMYL